MSHRHTSEHESHGERARRYKASLHVSAHELNVEKRPSSRRARIFVLVLAAALISGGFFALGEGAVGYRNYWGGTIFAPFAIAIGSVVLICALFFWPRLARTFSGKNGASVISSGSEWRKW
jgi:Na+/melibiose symporter-like transporter